MPGRNIFFAISLFGGFCSAIGCSDKDSPVVDKKFVRMELNAFTVDAYRFRVSLNNDRVITDSLFTPNGKSVSKDVFFDDYNNRIRVFNTSDETLLIDTPYTLSIEKKNVFTIYQTQANTTPFFLAPAANEPAPARGNTKLSLICTGIDLPDSIKLVLEFPSGITSKPFDSVGIKKDNFSRYFEFAKRNIRIRFKEIPSDKSVGFVDLGPNDLNDNFTFYRLEYNNTTSLVPLKLY